jgi:hypothetical protein
MTVHRVDQTPRTHIRPVLIDIVHAGLASVLRVNNGPAGRHIGEYWPQRMLTLIIHQHKVSAVLIIERARHNLISRQVGDALVMMSRILAAKIGPISSSGPDCERAFII